MVIELNFEQATAIVGANSGKISRIKDKLIKDAGYLSVETIGKGKKTIFKCEMAKDKEVAVEDIENIEVGYKNFKQRLIDNHGFTNRMKYNEVLKVLEFHIFNKELKRAMTIDEIAREIGISKSAFERHRRKLKGILTDRLSSEKVLFGLHEGEKVYRKIDDDLLNNIIYKVYANELKRIEQIFPNPHINDEVAIFIDPKVKTYRLVPRTGDFEFVKENLTKAGCHYESSYAVSFGDRVVRNERGRRVISDALKRKIFSLICRENNIEDTVDRYIYTLTNEIMEDEEFISEMVQALTHMRENIQEPEAI